MRQETQQTLFGGVVAGLIGFATVALVTAIVNLLLGRSILHTPALFGSVIFYGLTDPAQLEIVAGPIFAYNMVHLLAFLAFGLIASWLISLAERFPGAQYFILFLLIFIAAHTYAALLFFARPLLGTSSWWEIGIPSTIAAGAMAWYLWRKHPLLRQELKDVPMGAVPEDVQEHERQQR